MNLPFAGNREEDTYQKRLATLLEGVRHSSKVPGVRAADLLALLENLDRLSLVSNRTYWSRGFHFEGRVREH